MSSDPEAGGIARSTLRKGRYTRMLCQICKVNEAAVRYTEIINNSVTEIHLCQKCAHFDEKTPTGGFGFGGALGPVQETTGGTSVQPSDLEQKCGSCGHTLGDVMFQGRLGCADCYTAFREKLAPLIEKVHGASQHVGKIPSEKRGALSLRSELLRYRSQLRKAIEVENYEEAARLRDLIREVEKTMVKE